MNLVKCKPAAYFLVIGLPALFAFSHVNAQQNSDNPIWSSLSRGNWNYFANKDDFTSEIQCALRHSKETENSRIGISTKQSVQFQGSPGKPLMSLFYEEKERLRAYDPEFGMINKGPYSPWPELTRNADIKVGDRVSEGHLAYSRSTANDQFTSGVWERKTHYIVQSKFFDNMELSDELKFRVEGTVYEVPKPVFARFLECINYK